MLLEQDPDFVCLQEFDPLYRNATNGLIGQVSSQYTEVGINGVEKNKVWNPIFFNHKKYTLVTSGYVEKYDETSKEYNYPSGGTTNARCLVWAVLKNARGDQFLVANVHFSQIDAGENGDLTDRIAVHTAEATFVAGKVKELAAQYNGITTLVAGDMNSSVKNNADCGVDTMLDNGFTHTYTMASAKNNLESYHDGKAPSTGYLEWAIDHILTLNGDLDVRSFYVLNDTALYSVSDHLPVKMGFCK